MTTIASHTIADITRVHAAAQPDKVALVFGARNVTYGELDRTACQVAQALQSAGVVAGDRIAFLDKNSVEHFEVFFGAAKLNAVSVDINWRLSASEIAFIVRDASAKVFIFGQEFCPVVDTIRADIAPTTLLVAIGGHNGVETYERWSQTQPANDPAVPVTRSDIAFQLYSSGTTGQPKGVMLTHDNFYALLPTFDAWGVEGESVLLVAMPLFHIGGSGWATVGLHTGCTCVLVREFEPSTVVRLLVDHGVTHAFFVPAVLQLILACEETKNADFSSLHAILYGAAPISEDVLARALEVFGCDFWQAYGLTETAGAIVNLPPADHVDHTNRHRLRSAGVPGPGAELRILDTLTGEDLGPGQTGEVVLRSPQVMVGYWQLPDATVKALRDGWLHTGDVGFVDEDGYLYLQDRVNDMIVSGGENVYPIEVENVLMGHPEVFDAAVIGIPSERWGEAPVAVVVRESTSEISEAELISYCRERLAHFKCPTRVVWTDELPRNPSGKILKKDLRAPYWEGRDRFVS